MKISAIYSNGMKSLDAVDQIELGDGLTKRWPSISVRDDLVFEEVGFGAAIDSVSFEVEFLIESVEGQFGTIVPIERDPAVSGNCFDCRFIRWFCESIIGIVNLLDGLLSHEEIVGVHSKDQRHGKPFGLSRLLEPSLLRRIGVPSHQMKEVAREMIGEIYPDEGLAVGLGKCRQGGPVALVII